MSMAHSLEVRPPFLDHRIVEFAATLPPSLKMQGSRQKIVLKQLMKDKLPEMILGRNKVGFDVPAHEWLRGPLRELLLDTMQCGLAEHKSLFQPGVVQELVRLHLERRINIGYHLWGLLLLFLWMKKWRISGGAFSGSLSFLDTGKNRYIYLAVLLFAGAIYLGCIISPPSLMDDTDAVVAQAARTMMETGDWVTPRLDGVAYLEKPPLYYWPIVLSYKVFGIHDWAAGFHLHCVRWGSRG